MNKERVSYAGKRIYIGLDVHRMFFVASCICEGEVIKRCRLPSTSEAVLEFIRKYFKGAEIKTCYEAGYSGFWLHRALEGDGISNIVVHAAHVEMEVNRVKTDKRDSLKLAQQLSTGRLRGIRIPSEEEEEGRVLTRTREQLSRAKRRAQIQIRMRLHQFGLFPSWIQSVIQPAHIKNILEKLPSEDLKFSIELLYVQWIECKEKIKKIDKRLAEQAKIDPLQAAYRSVPGIGPLIARVLSKELEDMSQFRNEKVLFSFTGLTPGEYSSGHKVCRGHISRQGSSRLRHMLVEAAWKAIRKDTALREFYERLSARCGKKRAIVAVARKLVGRIRAALRARVVYEVGYKKVA